MDLYRGRRNLALAVALTQDGRTQQDIADAAGLYPTQLSAIKTGRMIPSLHQMQRIAAVLGKEMVDLFADTQQVAS